MVTKYFCLYNYAQIGITFFSDFPKDMLLTNHLLITTIRYSMMGQFWIEKKNASGRLWAVQTQKTIDTVQLLFRENQGVSVAQEGNWYFRISL